MGVSESRQGAVMGLDLTISRKTLTGIPFVAQWLTNPTRIHEDVGLIPGSLSGVRIQHRHELWLGSSIAMAVA